MVVALSEAKAQVALSGESRWDKFKEKLSDVIDIVWDHLSLDYHIEYWLQGLHHRRKQSKEARAELLYKRRERKNALDMRRRIAMGRTALYEEGEVAGLFSERRILFSENVLVGRFQEEVLLYFGRLSCCRNCSFFYVLARNYYVNRVSAVLSPRTTAVRNLRARGV